MTQDSAPLSQQTPSATLTCEVVVIGGGIAGLTQTVALAKAGVATVCIDPGPPRIASEAAPPDALDGRTTALLQGSLNVLSACGVDDPRALANTLGGEALSVMRIVDESGRPAGHPVTATFEAAESGPGNESGAGASPFGYNVPNATLRARLLEILAGLENGTHLAPARLHGLDLRGDRAVATLEDGRRIHARLAIGADGKNAPSREAAGIRVRRWGYGQRAMAFSIAHERPHGQVSTEFHREGGPFVLVPLPGNRSSVVWVDRARAVAAFHALDTAAFRDLVQDRTRGILGRVGEVGPRGSYTVETLIADRYAGPRLALIGEAAHALPPIGAQGLNLGLTDVATLTEMVVAALCEGRDPGAASVLSRYERARRPDVIARVHAIDTLNRLVMTRLPPVKALRHLGLRAAGRVGPLRTALMTLGMTPVGGTPALMRGEALPHVT